MDEKVPDRPAQPRTIRCMALPGNEGKWGMQKNFIYLAFFQKKANLEIVHSKHKRKSY